MKRDQPGFTLIELIVVLVIFAVLSVMAYGGLASVLNARTKVVQSLERTTALQKGYLRLRNDFQQLRARPARDAYGESQPSLLVERDGGVEFTRSGWRNPLSQPRSALERVAYRLDDHDQLVRRSWRVLDRAQDSQPAEVVVFEDVEEVQWRFLDPKLEWHGRWPEVGAGLPDLTGTGAAAASDAPPLAVELTLTLKDLGEIRYLFSARNPAP